MNTPIHKPEHINTRFILLALLFCAFALRIWGIWNATSTDEYNEVFEALRVCSGNLNLERWGKRFYLYVLAIEYGAYYAINWVLGVFASPQDFAMQVIRNLDPLFLIARSTSALFGTASVFLTFLIGKTLFNEKTGLVAALFLCLNVVHIELSHYARVDSSLCFLILMTFYCIVRLYKASESPRTKWYVLAGIFFGCAFQNKLPAVVLLVPFAFAHFSRFELRKTPAALFDKNIFHFAWAVVLGLIIGNPAVLLAPHKFIGSFLGMGRVYTTSVNETRSEHIGFIAYLIYFYKELGLFLSGVAAFSLLKSVIIRQKENLLLLAFMAPFFVLMGASRYMVSYSYMIPFMPFLYLMTANSMQEMISRSFPEQRKTVALFVVTVFVLTQPVSNVIAFERSMTGPNTRVLAKEWIEKNIPFGSKILMDSGKTINSSAPLIAMNEESIKRMLSAKTEALETGTLVDTTRMVDKKSLVYFEMLLKTVPRESYDITSTGFGLDVKSIEYYVKNNFQYFIISEGKKRARTNVFFTQRHPEIAKFYQLLDHDKRVKRIHTVTPSQKNRGGTFHIYKVSG